MALPGGFATGVGQYDFASHFHAAEPGAGAKTRLTLMVGRTCAAPRLRQSLAALGSGYGLNEDKGQGLSEDRGRQERPPPDLVSVEP